MSSVDRSDDSRSGSAKSGSRSRSPSPQSDRSRSGSASPRSRSPSPSDHSSAKKSSRSASDHSSQKKKQSPDASSKSSSHRGRGRDRSHSKSSSPSPNGKSKSPESSPSPKAKKEPIGKGSRSRSASPQSADERPGEHAQSKKVKVSAGNLKSWKEDKRVMLFLDSVGESRLRGIFDDNEVDFDSLLLINEKILGDIGVPAESRSKLLDGIWELKQKQPRKTVITDEDELDDETKTLIAQLSSGDEVQFFSALKKLRRMADDQAHFRKALLHKMVDVVKSSAGFPRLNKSSQDIIRIIKDLVQSDKNTTALEHSGIGLVLVKALGAANEAKDNESITLILETTNPLVQNEIHLRSIREAPKSATAFFQVATSGVSDNQVHALNTLYLMAANCPPIQEELLATNALEALGRYLTAASDDRVKAGAAKVLGGACAGERPNVMVQDRGVTDVIMGHLTSLAKRPVSVTRLGCAIALGFACDNNLKKKKWLVTNGQMSVFVEMLKDPSPEVQAAAARAIRCVCTNLDVKWWDEFNYFKDKYNRRVRQALAGAVGLLCGILLSANPTAREEALGALFELCLDNPNIYPDILRQVNAGPFVDAMNSGSANAAYYACGIVYFLAKDSEDRKNQFLNNFAGEAAFRLTCSQNNRVMAAAHATFNELYRNNPRPRLYNYAPFFSK